MPLKNWNMLVFRSKTHARTILTLFLAVGALWVLPLVPQGHASQGAATVYLLNFCSSVYGKDLTTAIGNANDVDQGAIAAATPTGRNNNVPVVHAVGSKTQPYFYSPTYQYVGSLADYVDIITNRVGAVVLNPCGSLFKIPYGYSWQTWIDQIANAMTQRRLTWINVGSYPFYNGLTEPIGLVYPHEAGLQRLLANVMGSTSANAVNLAPPNGLVNGLLTNAALSTLTSGGLGGWTSLSKANSVTPDQVLRKSQFGQLAVLPLYGSSDTQDTYWEGAVIGFAQTSSRTVSSGSGSFIQISGLHTYDNGNPPSETNKDYNEGYVATAAALYAESNQFTPSASYQKVESIIGERIGAFKINPVILGAYNAPGQPFTVRLAFGVYGAEQISSCSNCAADPMYDASADIENRGVSGVTMQVLASQSHNGDGSGTQLQGLANSASSDSWETPVSTALLLAGAWPPAAPFVTTAGAGLLLYDWSKLLSKNSAQCGFKAPPNAESCANFSFTPNQYASQPDSNHILIEFQTTIVLEVYVQTTDTDWTIIPIGYNFKMNTQALNINVGGEIDLALWTNNPGKTVRIFHDNFKADISEWARGSANGGDDYWGLIDSTLVDEAPVMWAAAVGNNDALGGVPNTQATCGPGGPYPPCYDINMNGYLTRDLSQLDLKAYSSVTLMFDARMQMNSGAYLKVEMGSFTQTYQGDGTDHFWQFYTLSSMPTDAQSLTFRFVSNGNTPVTHGVWIDTVDLIGTIWSDPGTGTVNGHASSDCSTATSLTPSASNYYGYLAANSDNPQSFYQFPASAGSQIIASLGNLLPGENLNLQLYDPNCNTVGSPATSLSIQASFSGNYRVKVDAPSGYGAYQLNLNVAGFTLSPAPATLNVNTPSSAQATVTVTATGTFSGIVNLAASGSPQGLTLSLNPQSVSVGLGGNAPSTLTVSTSSSTPTGSYTVTVTGTSESIIRQTSVLVNVVQGPAASFTYSPSHILVGQTVNFAATASMGTPPYSFTWNAPGAGTTSGSGPIFTTTYAVHGTYTVSVTVADANGLSATTSQNVQAYALPLTAEFTHTPASPVTSQTVSFNSNISFGSSPYTVSWTFGDGASATGNTPSHAYSSAGQYVVTLLATDSSGTNVRAVHCLAVGGSAPCDFSISATSTSGNAGTSLTSTITVTSLNGFAGTVSLIDSPPSGLGCGAITPSSVSGQGTATVSCISSVAGYYTLSVTGTSGSLSPSTSATFTVTDFTMSATSPAAAVAGTSPVSTITISALGASPGSISLTTTTIPTGLTCSLVTPYTVTPSATAIVSCRSSTAGSYTATFTGTGATLSHSTPATFTFTDFSIISNFNNNPPINVNTAITYPVSINGINGFSGTVSLSATMYSCQSDCSDGSPPVPSWTDTGTSQTTAQPSSCVSSSCTKSLTVAAKSAVGQFFLYVLATCAGCGPGASSHALINYFWVQCNASSGTLPADFCMWPDLTPLSVVVNAVPGEGIYLNSNAGYAGTVTLSASISNCISSCSGTTPPTVTWNDTRTLQTTAVIDPNAANCTPGPVWYCAKRELIIYAGNMPGEYTVTVTATCPASACTTAQSHILQIDFWVSPGGGGSVAAGSLITLADGSRVTVENLRVGMRVMSYDLTMRRYEISTVTRFFSVNVDNYMTFKTTSGLSLTTDQNPRQTLYVKYPNGTWTLLPVTLIKEGYYLFNAAKQHWERITDIDYHNGGQYVMYDIYTTTPGNYIANGILDPLKM